MHGFVGQFSQWLVSPCCRKSQEADPVLQLRRPERRGQEMWPTQDLTREIQVGETAWQIRSFQGFESKFVLCRIRPNILFYPLDPTLQTYNLYRTILYLLKGGITYLGLHTSTVSSE
jgi:hypothetical protein